MSREKLVILLLCIAMILSSISGIIACNRIDKLEDQVEELTTKVTTLEEETTRSSRLLIFNK